MKRKDKGHVVQRKRACRGEGTQGVGLWGLSEWLFGGPSGLDLGAGPAAQGSMAQWPESMVQDSLA